MTTTSAKIITRQCIACNKKSTITVDAVAYANWENGMMIQDAFPEMSSDQRELVMTGTHAECWDIIALEEE